MNILTAIANLFSSSENKESQETKVTKQVDIKFSTLIHTIQNDMIAANQSLQCVGLKYVEKFFDKEVETQLSREVEKVITEKIDEIDELLTQGETAESQALLQRLKEDVQQPKANNNSAVSYRPKMTSFDMPIFSNGVWHSKKVSIPLLALAPIPMPKITACTFTSNLQSVQQEGDDLIVKIQSNKNKRKRGDTDDSTALKISISPEQTDAELNDVISHYQKLLSSSKAS